MIGAATKRGQMFATDGMGGYAAIDPPVDCSHDAPSGQTYAADDLDLLLDSLGKGDMFCAGGQNTLIVVRAPDYDAVLCFDLDRCIPAWIPAGDVRPSDYIWTSDGAMPKWSLYRAS